MQYEKKLFIHIFTAMFIMVFLVSIATYIYEKTHIEEHIQEKVLHVTKLLTKDYMNMHNQNNKHTMSMDNNYEKKFLIEDKNVHLFKISDKNQNILIHKTSQEFKEIQIQIQKYKHSWKITNNIDTQITIIHNHDLEKYYVDVVMPLEINNGINTTVHILYEVTSYIQSVYQELYKNIIAVVLIGILILFAVYPTVLRLQKGLLSKTKALSQTNIDILNLLGSAIAKRDSDTHSHNYRVTLYALTLGETLDLSSHELRALIKGAFLHDVGKIGISDTILLKPGKLTDDEFEIMKQHVDLGKDIINQSEQLKDAEDVVYCHHEKYDGSGYPQGLKANDIPLNARIFAIADVFDALTSKRPYKEAFSYDKAYKIMDETSGSHFDPKLLVLFFGIAPGLFDKLSACINEDELKSLLHTKILEYMDISI